MPAAPPLPPAQAPPLWSRIPMATKVAVFVAASGFVVRLSSYSSSSSGGVQTSCSYTDIGALSAAAITAVAALMGFVQNRREPEGRRLPLLPMVVVTGALLAVAAVHVGRGIGAVGGRC